MARLFTLTALFSLCVITGASAECDSTDCQSCNTADCTWCEGDFHKDSHRFSVFGVCKPKKTDCAKVAFGTMNPFLKTMFTDEGAYDVEQVFKQSILCTPKSFPAEINFDSCETCLDPGTNAAKDNIWCDYSHSTPTKPEATGGVCLRRGLESLCNPDYLRWVVNAKAKERSPIKAKLATTVKQCSSERALPLGVAKCEDNKSCKTCYASGSSCNWCGGILYDSRIGKEVQVFGACRATDDCSKLKFGTDPNIFNAETVSSFSTLKLADTSDKCTKQEYGKAFENADQNECVSTGNGWCQLANTPDTPKTTVASGICMPTDDEFVCKNLAKERKQTHRFDINPKPIDPKSTEAPSTSTGSTVTATTTVTSAAFAANFAGKATFALIAIALGAYTA